MFPLLQIMGQLRLTVILSWELRDVSNKDTIIFDLFIFLLILEFNTSDFDLIIFCPC